MRQIVDHDFRCINLIRNEKFQKKSKNIFLFFFQKKFFWNFFFLFGIFGQPFQKMAFFQFLIAFGHTKLSKKSKKKEKKFWKFFWKKIIFLNFNFSFLIGFLHPKPWPTICLMSQLYDYIRKKYVVCIVFAHQGLRKPHSVLRYPVYIKILF